MTTSIAVADTRSTSTEDRLLAEVSRWRQDVGARFQGPLQPPWTAVSVLPLGLRERNCADGRDGRSQRPMKPRNSVMSK